MPTKTTKKSTAPTKRPVKVVRKPVKAPKKPGKPPQVKVPQVNPLPPKPVHPVPPVMVQPPAKTDAEKMWDEIKDLPIAMFGLPGQTVSMHVTPMNVDPNKLFLTIRSSATLPSLEESLKGRFNVELADKYVIVTRVPPPLVPRKR